MNDSYVKLAKLKGEFVWHQHDDADEMFLVIKGELLIKFKDQDVYLKEGEFLIVPKGTPHLLIAEKEAHIVLIEPKTTLKMGNVEE